MSQNTAEWDPKVEGRPKNSGEGAFYIYIVSDGSGETAANMMRALITQFSGVQGIYFRRYSRVKDIGTVDKIIANALQNKGPVLIAHTLVNSAVRDYLGEQCLQRGLKVFDLVSSLLGELARFFEAEPEENPGEFHRVNEKYFQRIEAIEFTLRHDDGKLMTELTEADIILVGVSRTGKTPLSIYLSLYGHKVVNVPLVKGVTPPAELDIIAQRKIVGLTIDPTRLMEIRRRRITGLNIADSEYSDPSTISEEIEEVNAYFRRHRRWPVIDVTNRSIEETATLVRDKVLGKDRLVH